MNRRQLVRGVASTGLMALGVSTAAGTTAPDAEKPYLSIRQDDGSRRVVHKADLEVEPDCVICANPQYCFQCPEECDCCECQPVGSARDDA